MSTHRFRSAFLPLLAIITIGALVGIASLLHDHSVTIDPVALEHILRGYYARGLLKAAPPTSFFTFDPTVFSDPASKEVFKRAGLDQGNWLVIPEGEEPPLGATTTVQSAFMEASIKLMNSQFGTTLTGYHFNQPPDPNKINIYFITDDPDGAFVLFRNNCASIGYKNIIICDATYVDRHLRGTAHSMAEYVAPGDRQVLSPGLLKATAAGMWLWFIGHEMGHIAHGHGAAHLCHHGFIQTRLLDRGIRECLIDEAFDAFSEQEAEADRFTIDVLRSLEKRNSSEVLVLQMGLSMYIVGEVNRLLQEQKPADGQIYLTARASDSHAPFLARAIHIEAQVVKEFMHHDAEGDTRRQEITSRIRVRIK